MKRNIRSMIFISAMGLCTVSCSEDFLDTTPSSSLNEANYFKTIPELESALYACYSLTTAYYSEPWMFSHIGFPLFALGDVGSDDSETGGGDPTFETESAFQEISMSRQATDNFISWFWWSMNYDLIAKCNLVIDKSIELLKDPDLETKKIEVITDQARFFRAFGFYNLVTMFGAVPMPTHFLRPDELDLDRTSDSILWKQIEQDLMDASDLPSKSEWGESGRISKGAVNALLGKAYMWQEKYKEAIETYALVIESGEYSLMEDYGAVFRHDAEHGQESIFEFQHAIGTDGSDMTTWLWIFSLPSDRGAGNGWGFGNPTQDLVDEFEAGDPRLMHTVIFMEDEFPSSFVDDGIYIVENKGSHTGYTSRKSWIPAEERTSWHPWNLDRNWRYCRYAEVLLFYAEALNEEGDTDKAKTYLNKIRARARETPKTDPERLSCLWDSTFTGELLPDISTSDPEELRRAIWHEQRVELAMEGHRRWILLRTKRFKERMEIAKGAKGCAVADHEWLLPINPTEVKHSKDRIKQNPGY